MKTGIIPTGPHNRSYIYIWANPIEGTAQTLQKMQSEGHYSVAHQHPQLQKLINRPNILVSNELLEDTEQQSQIP